MSSDEILLDAVYEKIKRGEGLSVPDLQRWVNFVIQAPLPVAPYNQDEVYGTYNKLITGIQEKFKQK